MNKRAIRLQLTLLLDQCDGCEYQKRAESSVQICSKCPLGKQIQRLGKMLDGEEVHIDGTKRRHWTEEEDFYLINHYGILPMERLAERLGRSRDTVRARIYALRKKGLTQVYLRKKA
ncbi:HTH domain-containing protein [Thermaerobacillus caldiproteolyticus]|uniref:HTH domain-containing protein n=1 Tax=Thermaerobacillus caldiproteolyticus TaxID=247480 RepID=UPI0018F133C4|nr:HTH domain-containing protein [Anoxybacillus caldiproteolyticus]